DTLYLHDALPIYPLERREAEEPARIAADDLLAHVVADGDKRRLSRSVGAGIFRVVVRIVRAPEHGSDQAERDERLEPASLFGLHRHEALLAEDLGRAAPKLRREVSHHLEVLVEPL